MNEFSSDDSRFHAINNYGKSPQKMKREVFLSFPTQLGRYIYNASLILQTRVAQSALIVRSVKT